MSDPRCHSDLIDLDNGVVDTVVFDSPTLYAREQRKVFARSWLFVAHESQIRRPGDFVVSRMAEDDVIVSRRRDGAIAVLLNVCRHRGMRVCRADQGNTTRFTCSYHGWSYDGGGRLETVPREREGYGGRLDKERWSLLRPPQVETFLGLVFACWDADAVPLAEWLGPASDLLRGAFDRSAAGIELVGGVHKWRLGGNWKLAAEQFTGDGYHVTTTHASAMAAMTGEMPAGVDRSLSGDGDGDGPGVAIGFPNGHGGAFVPGDAFGLSLLALPPELRATWHTEQARERLGPLASGPGVLANTVFPNFSWLGTDRTLRVWHPAGPRATEIWSWVFVDADWPDELKQAYRRYSSLNFSTTGVFEVDDSENWAEIDAVSSGSVTASVPLNYQMGLGRVADTAAGLGMDGRVAPVLSDANALDFHRQWAAMMDGPDPRLPDV